MEIMMGSLYFVSDEFFARIQDPYLKINYEDTKFPVIARCIDGQYIKGGLLVKIADLKLIQKLE